MATKGRDKNFVSMGFWIFSMFVMLIPLVNIGMTFIWAFTGQNETKKNYFKATLAFYVIILAGGFLVAAAFGALPTILQKLEQLRRLHR